MKKNKLLLSSVLSMILLVCFQNFTPYAAPSAPAKPSLRVDFQATGDLPSLHEVCKEKTLFDSSLDISDLKKRVVDQKAECHHDQTKPL